MASHGDLRPPAMAARAVAGEERQPYPPPYDRELAGKYRRALGDRLGLTKFGVNLTELQPGAVSSLRHWHSGEDEFVYVLEGELTLVTDDGEQTLGPGCVAGFPAGKPDGHRLVNNSGAPAAYLEVGNRAAGEEVHYSDADLVLIKDADGGRAFRHRDGEPY